MKRNKQWWKDLAITFLNEYQMQMFDDIAENLQDGVIRNDSGLSDDDYINELIDEMITTQFELTPEELDKLNHGEIE